MFKPIFVLALHFIDDDATPEVRMQESLMCLSGKMLLSVLLVP